MVFSLFFFLSYAFKLNAICHLACRRKFCFWVGAVPYDSTAQGAAGGHQLGNQLKDDFANTSFSVR